MHRGGELFWYNSASSTHILSRVDWIGVEISVVGDTTRSRIIANGSLSSRDWLELSYRAKNGWIIHCLSIGFRLLLDFLLTVAS